MDAADKEQKMSSRIKIRAQQADGITEVKALMRHPMETGMRKDQAGESIPAHFITEVAVFHGEPKPSDCGDPFVVDNWR